MRGGKRPGAGRKKGSVSKETMLRKQIAEQALASGISPLDVLLTAMRSAWDKGDHKDAASYAKEAAPYVHPRLAAVEHSGEIATTQEDRLRALVGVLTETQADDAAVH